MTTLARLLALSALLTACRASAPDDDEDGFDTTRDCNDADAAVNPDADETCNGVDDDCDGDVDDNAIDATTWHADGDGDGYGSHVAGPVACDAPAGHVADATDCDDGDAAYFPGAPETDCADPSDYNCDGSSGYADADGDGFAACEECDDAQKAIHPDAAEACDGADNDCDGDIDEAGAVGGTPFYADTDGDGFGDPDTALSACAAPDGYVANSKDCDDAAAGVHPGATETCNGADENCNGLLDEDAGDATTWYADSDKDGYGGTAFTVEACAKPSGYVESGDDCDDLDPKVKPGATEICDGKDSDCDGAVPADEADGDGDGVAVCEGDCDDASASAKPGAPERCNGTDDDCDGATDEADAIDPKTWYADSDEDGYGTSLSTKACDQPEGWASAKGDCDDTDDAYNPGASPGCDGEDYDCDGEVDSDGDGDGYPDVSCGGTDCDDSNPDILPEPGGKCAMGASCGEIVEKGLDDGDGTYSIDPDGYGTGVDPFDVWCDMTGGGWTYAAKNEPFRIEYTGKEATLVTPEVSTAYTFTLYGGSAGSGIGGVGGKGGKVWGTKTFGGGTTLYVYVGGKGDDGGAADSGPCDNRTGGFNGGGRGTRGGSGGGGGTDVRTKSGDLSSRILVAGGGGGCGYGGPGCGLNGGNGGGLTGEAGSQSLGGYLGGGGGTQSAGGVSPYSPGTGNGKFGLGANNVQCNDEGGGGGGWYGGAVGGKDNVPAGGGSSYYGGMDSGTGTTPGVNGGVGYVEYIFK